MDQEQPQGSVNVSMATIIDQLHTRYGRMIAQLMQENAELGSALEAQSSELDEFRSRFLAQQVSRAGGPMLKEPVRTPLGAVKDAVARAAATESARKLAAAMPPLETVQEQDPEYPIAYGPERVQETSTEPAEDPLA